MFRLLIPVVLLMGFSACTRHTDPRDALPDLIEICRAQKSYLETRKLMPTVSDLDLAKERQIHFDAGVKTPLIRDALAEALRAPAGSRRRALDKAALSLSLKDWKCAELDQL